MLKQYKEFNRKIYDYDIIFEDRCEKTKKYDYEDAIFDAAKKEK